MTKAAALVLIGCAIAPAQQPLAFELATIKPLQGYVNARGSASGPRITLSGYALEGLLMDAYGVESWQLVGGPVWRDTDPFEIVAKAPGDTAPTPEQSRQMLRTLLEDRFKLKVHRELRDAPVYALVVAKNGPKLKKSTANDPLFTGSGREMKFQKLTMDFFAKQLSSSAGLGRPVLDKTGLTGEWDFTLRFMRNPPPDSNIPGVFTALQEQLGLKLESQKAQVEHLIIDHAEKPSAN
jgi:uncharacterized protein (TIGR03435 family)